MLANFGANNMNCGAAIRFHCEPDGWFEILRNNQWVAGVKQIHSLTAKRR